MTISDQVTDDHRELANLFAHTCFEYFEEGMGKLDTRIVNKHIASITDDLPRVARPWDLKTTRYHEKVIRVDNVDGHVADVRSYELPLRSACYEVTGTDRETFVAEIETLIISHCIRLAEEEEELASGFWTGERID